MAHSQNKFKEPKKLIRKIILLDFNSSSSIEVPSIPMKSPSHSVSIRDVPVAAGPLVSSENESGTSQGRYRVQQNPRKIQIGSFVEFYYHLKFTY